MNIAEVFGVSGKIVARAVIVGALCVAASAAAAQPTPTPAQLQDAWGAAIARTPVPGKGCFTADYPSRTWTAVACTTAPNHRYEPRHGASGYTVGDGNDYTAVSSGTIASSVGSFSVVKGVTLEEDGTTANEYSLQLNTQFFSGSPACAKAAVPAKCLAWQQFVFAEDDGGYAFMQYWLIDYATTCAKGWIKSGKDCYYNSDAVRVPAQVIKKLKKLKVSGAAVADGLDTMVLTTAKNAYSTTGQDSVVGLAPFWDASEFNVFGDGDGTAATFNAGAELEVNIAVDDGTTTAPTCKADSGTTAETNNLTLAKKCKTTGGTTPSVSFVESD